MRLEIPDDFLEDGRFHRADSEAVMVLRLLFFAARECPDGFLPDSIKATPGFDKLLARGWVDASPLRIRGWLEYAGPALRNRCRTGKARGWLDETLKKWEVVGGGVGGPGGAVRARKASAPKALPPDAGVVSPPDNAASPEPPRPAEPEQLTLDGGKDKPAPRKTSGQQKIIEKYAECRGLDMSTKEARALVAKQSAAASASIDRLSEGNTEMALLFVELACATKDEEIAEWKKRDGQDHAWRNLSALLPLWSEFKAAWDRRKTSKKEASDDHREKAEPAA